MEKTHKISSAKSIIAKIDKRSDNEKIRSSLYSVFVSILLSKEIFTKNDDIKEFLNAIDINFKDYVYKSRTLILARVLRNIEKSEAEDLYLYLETCKKLLFPNVDEKINAPKKESGSLDDLLSQFKRR